jgi:hypothetical protein
MDQPQQPMEDGINPYELPNLPDEQRRVLQLILKEREITYSRLVERIQAMPDFHARYLDNLDTTLEQLHQEGHILIIDEGETTFKANMRRKSGRNLTIKGIWDVLDGASQNVDQTEKRKNRSTLASALYGSLDDLMKKDKKADDQDKP